MSTVTNIHAFFKPIQLLLIYEEDPDTEGLDWEEMTWNLLERFLVTMGNQEFVYSPPQKR